MSNALNVLLKMDKAKVEELPTKVIEIKRLTELTGEKFEVTLRAINGERMSDIQKNSIDISKKGGVKDINLYSMQTQILTEGMVDPNLKDKSLLEHFGCVTPKDLIKTLFLAGEINDLANEVQELSGYDKSDDEDLKK